MRDERFKRQKEEFDAAERLAAAYRVITWTAIVDDDYPEVRHKYEAAVHTFLKACKANGRTME